MPRFHLADWNRPTISFRIALTGIALVSFVLLSFAAYMIFRSDQGIELTDTEKVRKFIVVGDFESAYDLLQVMDTNLLEVDDRSLLAYQWAICERNLDKPRKAYTHLNQLANRIPKLEQYRSLWMARALEKLGELQGAELSYRDLIMIGEPVVADSARLYLASMLQRIGDLNEAVRIYDQQLERSGPADAAELLYEIIRIHDQAGNRDSAVSNRLRLMREHTKHRKALDAALTLKPRTADESYRQAYVFYQHRKHQQATKALYGFIDNYPLDDRVDDAQYRLGRTYLRNGQFTKARRTFEKLYALHKRPDALYGIGGMQVSRDHDLDAIGTYERLVKNHPRHNLADDALWQAAKAAERESEFSRAKNLYSRLSSEYPQSPLRDEASWSKSFMLYCAGLYEKSLDSFQRVGATSVEPHIVDQSYFWAGKSAQQLGLKKEANKFFQRVAENFPRSYYATRAVSMGYPGSIESDKTSVTKSRNQRSALNAVATLTLKATYGTEVQPLAALQRTDFLDRLGLKSLAEQELFSIERLNSNNSEALRVIRDCYEDIGSLDRALRLSTKISTKKSKGEISDLYPNYYWAQVKKAAHEAKVDPYLVLSVIRQESYFNEDAVSRAGALGLMQIMPKTGRLIARSIGLRPFDQRLLFDPAVSIRMGTRYLGEQIRAFDSGPTRDSSCEISLAAYNAGPKAAQQWIERFPIDDPDIFVERIPYKETRLYVKKVLKNYTIYKALSEA